MPAMGLLLTITVKVAELEFPTASVAVYITVLVPGMEVLTVLAVVATIVGNNGSLK